MLPSQHDTRRTHAIDSERVHICSASVHPGATSTPEPSCGLAAVSAAVTETPIRSDEPRVQAVSRRTSSDRVFRAVVRASAALTFGLMILIGFFLTIRAWDALHVAGFSFFTKSAWLPETGQFGVWAALLGTILIAVIALILAVPVSICTALYVTEYAPARLRRTLTTIVDVLAAVPSIIYGLWGRYYFTPRVIPFSRWLATHLEFIPFFHVNDAHTASYSGSTFIAGLVVALMIVPICTAVMREVFSQAPAGEKEGALALGGTKWNVIKTVVLPFGKGGIIGGSMLGLGRALGETIAVTLIIAPLFNPGSLTHVLQLGGNSIASLIALRFSESNDFGISALMAAGLTLFVITLIVNAFAAVVVSRSRSGSATEI
jgi:phosphate transport system permease protein